MKVRINLIEDRGIRKKLHFVGVASEIEGWVEVNDTHLWFDKQVDDYLNLSDHI